MADHWALARIAFAVLAGGGLGLFCVLLWLDRGTGGPMGCQHSPAADGTGTTSLRRV